MTPRSDAAGPARQLRNVVTWLYMLRRRVASEERFVRRALRQYAAQGGRLLDIGCGFGRFHEIVRESGLEYTGVDANARIVQRHRAAGRNVVSAAEFTPEPHSFDVLLLSHIVEHFEPAALVSFLNPYVRALRPGGLVILLTPLENRGFYDDFDHVKPYNPEAIRQLFCHAAAQTRGFGLEGRFGEVGLWFKRDPLWHSHRTDRWQHFAAIPLTLLYVLTGGLAGRLNGYGMVLEKAR